MNFDNEIILITGGTGSFGLKMVEYFLSTNAKEIRVFSRDEKKQEEVRNQFKNAKLQFYIGDVRDYSSISSAMKNVSYVFHASALKQVPSCEFYPMEALKTNVIGAENTIEAAIKNGVKKMVLLSTDKAVYPINAMGQTKALMEKVMLSKARALNATETILCATRYGNVIASRGSVIPLFISQLLEDKPITVTDPSMTRFLMSLNDSVNLVLYALEHGSQGDIYVQKSPAATVENIALALKEGFRLNNPIKVIGTRHGEKLYESLISREEMARAIDLGGYYRIPPDNRNLNYDMYVTLGEKKISDLLDYTSHNAERLSLEQLIHLFIKLNLIK